MGLATTGGYNTASGELFSDAKSSTGRGVPDSP